MTTSTNVKASDKYQKTTNSKEQVNNKIVKNQKVSDIIIEAFNVFYNNTPYYLVMTPFDNDVTLDDTIILPDDDFNKLLARYQQKFNLYKYGYNIFKDGNIIYILNKNTPSTLEMFNEWKFTFIIKSESKENLNGMYPYIYNEEEKHVQVYIPYSDIQLRGDVTVDSDETLTTILVTPKGEKITPDEELKTTFTNVVSISHELNKDGSTSTTINHKKVTSYLTKQINLRNTFLTFLPGDEIEIKSHENPDYLWRGTVKRWGAQAMGKTRDVFLIVTGVKEDPEPLGGLFGELASALGLSDFVKKNNIKNLKDATNFIHKAVDEKIGLVDDILGKIDEGIDALDNLPGDVASAVGNYIGGAIDDKLTDFIDQNIGKELFNDIMDFSATIYNSPYLQPYIQKGWAKLTEAVNKTMNDVFDAMFLSKEELEDKVYLERLKALQDKYSSSEDNFIVDGSIFEEYTKDYYFFADGFDTETNNDMIYDIKANTGEWLTRLQAKFVDEREISVLRYDILSNLKHNMIKKYSLFGIDNFIRELRSYYKDRVITSEENKPEPELNYTENDKVITFIYEDRQIVVNKDEIDVILFNLDLKLGGANE